MTERNEQPTSATDQRKREYHPPMLTRLGDVAAITEKTVGRSDGSTFLGLAIGSS